MQRFLDVRETALDLGHDLDKIIDIKAATGWAGYHGDASFSQIERFEYFPTDAHLFVRLGGERNPYRVADAVVQQHADAHRRLYRPPKRRAGLGHAEMERIIDLFGH